MAASKGMVPSSLASLSFQDYGDADELTRTELQKALKEWNLPSGGTNAALRERYTLFRNSRITRNPHYRGPSGSSGSNSNGNKRKRKSPPKRQEKRLRRYRSSCPMAIQQRIARAETQRMFLVQKGSLSKGELSCEFVVLGSTGNVYTVTIQRLPHCTCPDHARGNLCKHILFVLLKVMALNPESSLIFQAAWISSELQSMFEQMDIRYRQVSGAVLANERVRETFQKLSQGEALQEETSVACRREAGVDDDCPICFDALISGGKTTFCRARCGANFHQLCIQHWLQQNRQNPTCPMCRVTWDDGKKKRTNDTNREGYTNLGGLQGQSPDRDTSSYSSWSISPHRKRRRWW